MEVIALDYKRLKTFVVEFINNETSLDSKEIIARIKEAYENYEISGHEYDDLMQYMVDFIDE